MTEELKPLPCPFCNSKPEVRHESMGTDYSVVVCPECLARGPESEPEQAAIKAWNTRSPAWRDDMENAPEHTPVLVWGHGFEQPVMASLDVTWDLVDENGYRLYDAHDCAAFCTPTRWMPLPLPPEEGR